MAPIQNVIKSHIHEAGLAAFPSASLSFATDFWKSTSDNASLRGLLFPPVTSLPFLLPLESPASSFTVYRSADRQKRRASVASDVRNRSLIRFRIVRMKSRPCVPFPLSQTSVHAVCICMRVCGQVPTYVAIDRERVKRVSFVFRIRSMKKVCNRNMCVNR